MSGRGPGWLLLAVLAALLGACGAEPTRSQPNVVVIVMDTTRFDRMGFNGYAKGITPFFDSLAARGVVFDRAFAGSSWTAPATASIFTSLYPDQHGVTRGYFAYQRESGKDPELRLNRLPSAAQTLPELMRAAGYRTFCVADNQNICERVGFSRGFDYFVDWSYRGGAVVDAQLEAWDDQLEDGERPFFLYLQYMDPHKPYHEQAAFMREEGTEVPNYTRLGVIYDSEVAYVDSLVADVFERLELERNSIVILTADHGEEFGEHGRSGHAGGLYPELLHVPLMLLSLDAAGEPGFEPGHVAGRVSTLDLLPTLAELLGQPEPAGLEGRSLVPELEGARERPAGRGRALFSHRDSPEAGQPKELYSIIEGDWQLIEERLSGTQELFNLERDPSASRELSGQRPQVLERLAGQLEAFRGRERVFTPEFAEPVTLDQEAQDELSRLGYAE